jgi:hypothetical protein
VHINDAASPCSGLDELDLSSRSLDLPLCRVLQVWDIRSTRQKDGAMAPRRRGGHGGGADGGGDIAGAAAGLAGAPHPSCAMAPLGSRKDDGPQEVIYKRVLSVEICQMIAKEEEDDDNRDRRDGTPHPNPATTAVPRDGGGG